MTIFYKAVRPDGGSFNYPSFRWAVEPGGVTTHPLRGKAIREGADGAAGYLSVSVEAADCTGFRWPCRLLVVEPVGRVWTPGAVCVPSKRAGLRWRTVAERPGHEAFGPQGAQVVALLDRCRALTPGEVYRLAAARAAARDAAWDAARAAARAAAWDAAWAAARDAARDAAWDAAWDAARAAALGMLVRDLLTTVDYNTLTGACRAVVGPIHPDDPDWKETP